MKSVVWKVVIPVVFFSILIAVFCVRYMTRVGQLETASRYLVRTENNWLGEKWIFSSGAGNGTNRFKGVDDVCSVSFHVNGDPASNVVVTSSGGVEIEKGDYTVRTTPVFSDFDYEESAYYKIEKEEATYPTFWQILFSGRKDFDRTAGLLQAKLWTLAAISNKIHVIEKPPYKGIAYHYKQDRQKCVFFLIDDGNTNRYCSVFVCGRAGYPRNEVERTCREIISSFEFHPAAGRKSESLE